MKILASLSLSLFFVFFYMSFAQDKGSVQEAYDAMEKANYETAIVHYTKALETYESYAPSWYGRGLAYAHLERYEESNYDLSKAIEINSSHHQAYYARGLNHSKLGNNSDAIDDFSSAISINGEIAEYYYARGNSYTYTEDHLSALDDYNKAIQLNPNYGISRIISKHFRILKNIWM